MTSPLCAVSQYHGNDFIKSLESANSQYRVRVMTVAHLAFIRFSAVEVEDMHEQRKTALFLKEGLALAIVDGLHSRCCIQKLADSEELETWWSLQPARVTFVEAPGFRLLAIMTYVNSVHPQKILRLAVRREKTLGSVIKSLVQHRKTFEMSCDEFFDEARISGTCRDLVRCEYLQVAVQATYRP